VSILSSIKTALDVSGVTSIVGADGVYSDAIPQDKTLPAVVLKRTLFDPVMTLQGPEGTANSVYVFECWASTKSGAIALAGALGTAIEAAAGLSTKYRLPYDGDEQYEPTLDQFCEPVQYSFWHSTT
jgi:hypothetical protein